MISRKDAVDVLEIISAGVRGRRKGFTSEWTSRWTRTCRERRRWRWLKWVSFLQLLLGLLQPAPQFARKQIPRDSTSRLKLPESEYPKLSRIADSKLSRIEFKLYGVAFRTFRIEFKAFPDRIQTLRNRIPSSPGSDSKLSRIQFKLYTGPVPLQNFHKSVSYKFLPPGPIQITVSTAEVSSLKSETKGLQRQRYSAQLGGKLSHRHFCLFINYRWQTYWFQKVVWPVQFLDVTKSCQLACCW